MLLIVEAQFKMVGSCNGRNQGGRSKAKIQRLRARSEVREGGTPLGCTMGRWKLQNPASTKGESWRRADILRRCEV
jgi:hypothetical protein